MRKTRIVYFLIITILISFKPCIAGQVEAYFRYHNLKPKILKDTDSIQQFWFTQFIDHDEPLKGTFQQRYYVDETYGTENNSPVFFFICGEAACEKHALNGAIRHYAKKFKAKLIALEHRYYGESQPKENLSVESLKFLSTNSALQDLANFQQAIRLDKNWTGPWVVFGGSYPGSLAAFYRLKYPELASGALASSAPVMAKENFYEYDQHVTQVAGSRCARDMRFVIDEVEFILNSRDKIKINQLKSLFSAQEVHDDTDFLYLLADVGAGAVQYGMHDEFCSSLSSADSPLAGYAEFAQKLFRRWDVNPVELTPEGAMSIDLKHYIKGVGSRQWLYQSCTEYGYWQNANADREHSTRSARIDNAYHRDICHRLFALSTPAETESMNHLYYWPLFNPRVSHIFFTNGSNDPWSNLSLTEQNKNDTNPNLTYMLIQGSAHCDDLRYPARTDSAALTSARNKMESCLKQWLS